MWKRSGRGASGGQPPVLVPIVEATNEPEQSALVKMSALLPSLGQDASVTGKLSFTRPTRLDGTLRGEVRASDLLVVGETGFVDGEIRAARLVILGRVRGSVIGAEHVEIGRGAILQGTVETRSLVVQEGGRLNGECKVVPPVRATVHVLHPKPAEGGDSGAESLG